MTTPVHTYRHVTLPTVHGPQSFTDVTFFYEGQAYGSRFHGIFTKEELAFAGQQFLRRRWKEAASQ